jgi:hypothetical protein
VFWDKNSTNYAFFCQKHLKMIEYLFILANFTLENTENRYKNTEIRCKNTENRYKNAEKHRKRLLKCPKMPLTCSKSAQCDAQSIISRHSVRKCPKIRKKAFLGRCFFNIKCGVFYIKSEKNETFWSFKRKKEKQSEKNYEIISYIKKVAVAIEQWQWQWQLRVVL